MFGWDVMDWQGVTNFDKSAENYFGRILLPRRAGGLAAVRHGGEGGRSVDGCCLFGDEGGWARVEPLGLESAMPPRGGPRKAAVSKDVV